jgi:glycosyltransferase involved in cell wall biosynthesis
MNIILVNHYAGGKRFGMEFRPYYMAKEWGKAGHKVVIVAASYAHLRSVQPVVTNFNSREVIDEVDYLWIKTNRYHGNGMGRILSMLFFTFKLFFLHKKLRDFKPDLIIASSTYTIEAFPLFRMARKLKAKFCYEVHDLWPLSPIEFGGYSKYHPFIRIMQWGEDYAYKHSDFVVSLLPAAKPYMVSRGLKPEKFVYIPNGIDVSEWAESDDSLPPDHTRLLNDLRTKNQFVIGYAGSHGIANSLASLVEASKFLDNNIAIVFVGDGPEKKPLQDKVSREGIKNVYFLDPIPKRKIPLLLTFFDGVYVAFQKQSLLRFGISPNKMFDYMMAEKPIIQAIEAGNNLVKDYNCGIAVEPENPHAIATGITKLKSMTVEERIFLGKNGKAAVLRHHNFSVLCQQFIDAAEKPASLT